MGTSLFALELNFTKFQANFTQTITDDNNKSIVYKGEVYAKKPSFNLWQYQYPIQKSVYSDGIKIIMIEPDLEQVLYTNISQNIDFFNIIASATETSKNHFNAHYKDMKFEIIMDENSLQSISYHDNFDNLVLIDFEKQHYNTKIEDSFFTPNIPQDYDIIHQ
jgi:outer membrane lipoprotein carrier protein